MTYYCDIKLDHLAELCFSTVKLLFLLLLIIFYGSKSPNADNTKEEKNYIY